MSKLLAAGTNRMFQHTEVTMDPDRIWMLWTNPATWGDWDKGLKSASMEGAMEQGSEGIIEPLSGKPTTFKVTHFEQGKAYSIKVRLVLSDLRIERSFNKDRTEFTHSVQFSGPLAFLFAGILGKGFRKALPPTMQALKELAQRQAI